MNYPRIEVLSGDWGYNDIGDVIKIVEETPTAYYYYDGMHRWCFVPKSEEGKTYRYISAGERTNYGRGKYANR